MSIRNIGIGSEDFTKVVSIDDKEFNAYHSYRVHAVDSGSNELLADIQFQKGPIKEKGVNGCHHEDLIAIVIDRLQCFQDSEYRCRENDIAITKLEETLQWLRHRTNDRRARNVEGTSKI